MAFIQIVEENEPFWWTPEDEAGAPMESRIQLRVLSDETLASLRKKHTHGGFKHGQRVEDFDAFAFASDVTDKAVVAWERVYKAGTTDVLPCERATKLRLPERLKLEIIRLCAGKEAGRLFDLEGADTDGGTDPNAR